MLGDLVYCKEQETEKEMSSSHSECQDGSDNDAHVDCHLDDISVTDLPEERNTLVKVMFCKIQINHCFNKIFRQTLRY